MYLTVVDFVQWTFCIKWELNYKVTLNVIPAQIHQFSCLPLNYSRFHDGISQKTKSFKQVVSWSPVHNLSIITRYVFTLNWSDGQWWSLTSIPMDLVRLVCHFRWFFLKYKKLVSNINQIIQQTVVRLHKCTYFNSSLGLLCSHS